MRLEMLLRQLEIAQAELARELLERPTGRDAFEYGRSVGMYAGIEHAKNTLINLVAEKERKDFDL